MFVYIHFLRRVVLFIKRVLKINRNKAYLSWNIRYPDDYTDDYANINGEQLSEIIQQRICSKTPTLLTRFGSDILMCALASINRPTFVNSCKYILGWRDSLGLPSWVVQTMTNNAGFFSTEKKYLESDLYRYGDIINSIIPDIDLLGTVLRQERVYKHYFDNIARCFLLSVEPYRSSNPWTKSLRGKRVLVIHPFEATIRYQYENSRTRLFSNPDVLPEFTLLTIRAVQSIAGNKPKDFANWYEALHFMERQIDVVGDFDVAIIGCGAYGMPLAAYIKRLGKIAIHLGGGVQYLFGIKNKRADNDEDATVRNLYNDAWIRPLPIDTPQNIERVEDGCYW